MKVFEKDYDSESLINFEESIHDAIQDLVDSGYIPQDKYGLCEGMFTVRVIWDPEE